jgi:hypothetical protein
MLQMAITSEYARKYNTFRSIHKESGAGIKQRTKVREALLALQANLLGSRSQAGANSDLLTAGEPGESGTPLAQQRAGGLAGRRRKTGSRKINEQEL